jgi:hypothetical protein
VLEVQEPSDITVVPIRRQALRKMFSAHSPERDDSSRHATLKPKPRKTRFYVCALWFFYL